MTNPIEAARQFYQQTVHPFLEDVGEAVSDVGSAVVDAGGDVVDAVREEGVFNVAGDLATFGARQTVDVLAQLQQRSPADFVAWLTGPEGPSFADATAQVPGLQQAIGDVIDGAMDNPMIAGAVGQAFGFEYVPGHDFYTTNEGSLQSYFGFHDAYDKVGKLLGMDLEEKVVEVEVDGVEYRLELWQGSYGNGGAYGGEIGFYTRGTGERGPLGNLLEKIPGYYSSANGDSQIRMKQTIYDASNPEQAHFENPGFGTDDGEHYWNLAIRTDPGVNHEDIGQRGELVFEDAKVARALYDAMAGDDAFRNVELSADGKTITYDWP